MSTNHKIAIAQINTKSGDIEFNAKKIIKNLKKAQENKFDIIIFPELALIGMGLCDAVKRYPIIIKQNKIWLQEIASITNNTTAIIGFIDEDLQNSVAIIQNGQIKQIVKKSQPEIIEIAEKYYYINLNEKTPDNINGNFDAIINIFAKHTSINKETLLNKALSNLAKTYSKPVIYCDLIGANDSFVYDGLSRVFNKNGELITCAKPFEEDFVTTEPFCSTNQSIKFSITPIQTTFSLDYESDLERTYKTLILGIKDYFAKTGFKRAVLGLSGGLDSTVCAVILADALGAENVFGISMPSKLTSIESKTDAQELAQNLGINFAQAPIKEMVETCNKNFQQLFNEVEQSWDYRYKKSFTMDNIQARSRAMYLWGISNEFGSCLPIATSDKSESYMGYATINGDMSGGVALIADITKTKLFALARWLNKNRHKKNAIPESIILKKPGAELAIDPNTGKTLNAEDALMPYEFLDEIIWRVENNNETYEQMITSEFIYEKKENISKEQKEQWLEKFYKRMSTSHYKWSILPPAIITDSHSINSQIYSQPITSSGIDYKGVSKNNIEEKIKNFS